MKRRAAVAGRFYYGEKQRLEDHVRSLLGAGYERAPKEDVKAALCPHAGLMYSGAVAGAVYSRIRFPRTFVLMGPNHTGFGSQFSIMSQGGWETPLGDVAIDEWLAARIKRNVPLITEDMQAHLYEHSLEVQLPFIRFFSEAAAIVPITVMSASLEELKAVGEGIARSVGEAGYPVVLIASSDMSHFIADEEARGKDKMAIDKVLALDAEGLYSVVKGRGISMCGVLPAVSVIEAARGLGATEGRLVKYATSADVSGDYESVVGYAGIIMK